MVSKAEVARNAAIVPQSVEQVKFSRLLPLLGTFPLQASPGPLQSGAGCIREGDEEDGPGPEGRDAETAEGLRDPHITKQS